MIFIFNFIFATQRKITFSTFSFAIFSLKLASSLPKTNVKYKICGEKLQEITPKSSCTHSK